MSTLGRATILDEKQEIDAMLRRLGGSDPALPCFSIGELREKWRNRPRSFWRVDRRIYDAMAAELVGLGENFLALEVADEGLTWFPRDTRLLYFGTLACARSGAIGRAEGFLARLEKEEPDEPDHISLRARVWKDLSRLASNLDRRMSYWLEARALYLRAEKAMEERARNGKINHKKAAFPGINAASLWKLTGGRSEALEQTAKVRRLLGEGPPPSGDDIYWEAVTHAECSLIEDDIPGALNQYKEATAHHGNKRGNLATTYRQARWLMENLGHDAMRLRDCFPFPKIILFSGHIIDAPNRPKSRFPVGSESRVAESITSLIHGIERPIAYSSAACGGDILFLEAMQRHAEAAHAVETHIVLPFDSDTFHDTSVAGAGRENWSSRYRNVIECATSVTALPTAGVWSQNGQLQGVAFDYSNQVLCGTALMKSQESCTELSAICVWDGLPGDGSGGTADCVALWKRCGIPVEVIQPMPNAVPPRDLSAANSSSQRSIAHTDSDCIAFFIAGSFVPVAACGERQLLASREAFFSELSEILLTHEPDLGHRSVFGESFLIAFDTALAAAIAAIATANLRTRYSPEYRVELGVHCGPAMHQVNAVTGRAEYIGSHSSKAAVLSKLPADELLYVSREFAAFLALTPNETVRCEYLGIAHIGPEYGSEALFHLGPRMPA